MKTQKIIIIVSAIGFAVCLLTAVLLEWRILNSENILFIGRRNFIINILISFLTGFGVANVTSLITYRIEKRDYLIKYYSVSYRISLKMHYLGMYISAKTQNQQLRLEYFLDDISISLITELNQIAQELFDVRVCIFPFLKPKFLYRKANKLMKEIDNHYSAIANVQDETRNLLNAIHEIKCIGLEEATVKNINKELVLLMENCQKDLFKNLFENTKIYFLN